ncbi:hypothetical protein Nepgr_005515 [Nepenthes gracilis]|uniref:CCHC-type domain-containing protein n=1 Tax=Nepenthes gracilis TaxID=150966 RepID=A0AAD3XGN9_NEPGR|nr:hypothetical protein Nepgr_005515 [Nepenthes gracilis]
MSCDQCGNSMPLKRPEAEKNDDEVCKMPKEEGSRAGGLGNKEVYGVLNRVVEVMNQLIHALPQKVHSNNCGEKSVFQEIIYREVPEFMGEPDPIKAENWIRRLEKTFKFIKCSEEEKVKCATFKLYGEADHWWIIKKKFLNQEMEVITWDRFLEVFNEKYIPKSFREKMEEEFICLRQGGSSVAQYGAKFLELSRFAPYLVSDETMMAKRFLLGLNDVIRKQLVPHDLTSYNEVLDRAFLVEQELERTKVEEKRNAVKGEVTQSGQASSSGRQFKKRKFEGMGDSMTSSNVQGTQREGQLFPRKLCSFCGKHRENQPCYQKLQACFNCGKTGHIIRDCPSVVEG